MFWEPQILAMMASASSKTFQSSPRVVIREVGARHKQGESDTPGGQAWCSCLAQPLMHKIQGSIPTTAKLLKRKLSQRSSLIHSFQKRVVQCACFCRSRRPWGEPRRPVLTGSSTRAEGGGRQKMTIQALRLQRGSCDGGQRHKAAAAGRWGQVGKGNGAGRDPKREMWASCFLLLSLLTFHWQNLLKGHSVGFVCCLFVSLFAFGKTLFLTLYYFYSYLLCVCISRSEDNL